jgi:beta-galactosidase
MARSAGVRSMELYGQNYGFILYRTVLCGPKSGKLVLNELRDVGYVYLDGRFIGRLERRLNQNSIDLPASDSQKPILDILVEAMGRINFGSRLIDRKGITEWVTLQGVTLMQWEVFPLPFDKDFLGMLKFERAATVVGPGIFRGTFELVTTGDTFLDMHGWKKGVVWVNGHHLGRYWNVGPQQRLYLPAPWLKKRRNQVIIFDPEVTSPVSLSSFTVMN